MGENVVRASTEPVVANSAYVDVNVPEYGGDGTALDMVVDELYDAEFAVPYWDESVAPVFPDESWSDEDRMQFFYVGNVLNAHFTEVSGDRFAVDYRGNPWGVPFDGAFGMWAAVKRGVENGYDLLDADYLAEITETDVREIFAPAPDAATMPLLVEDEVADDLREHGLQSRHEMLQDAGRFLQAYDGLFANVVAEADGELFGVDGVVDRLVDSPAYRDAWTVDGKRVRFDKRAQLLVTMLHGVFQDEDAYEVAGLDDLTVFADYRLPQTLAYWGLLSYDDDRELDYDEGGSTLQERVVNGDPIDAGSREEVEIRAATVQIGDALLAGINEKRVEEGLNVIGVPELDYALWKAGKEVDGPHHVTRTTAY